MAETDEPKNEPNLKIIGYDVPQGSGSQSEKKDETFTVDFNPSTFNIVNNITYKTPRTKGSDGADPVWESVPPIDFNITFTIDGTGATKGATKPEYVRDQIVKLRKITGVNGEIHRPNYLAVLWGKIHIECVVTSLNITFTLFDRDGRPLRAKVVCNFKQRRVPGEEARRTRLESADLSKSRLVKEGDILPLIARRNYDSSSYYLQIARANKLKNFRKLEPGMTLILPPMADK